MSIQKLLVANRGEIARRIFRACRCLGIATVAVYAAPDRDAWFVQDADESVPLATRATPVDAYLDGAAVIEAARRAGADAVHPGYGFLSENAAFAEQCLAAGLCFVGPSPSAIATMGSKLRARALMAEAGVPVLPGADLTGVDDEAAAALAAEIGWPVLVKASSGGGGRGMRVVRRTADLADAVGSARREAAAAFGDDTVFLERYVERPRHIEVQIFGDATGQVRHLNERECSVQRRHQKVIEESPSPFVTPELRAQLGDAAVRAGKAIGYVGAGTVEFVVDQDGAFFFLEMNTRLQVEHPVTELVSGVDLVRLQLLVAAGGTLEEHLGEVRLNGHAVEARLYAEDPANGYLPSTGTLVAFELPDTPGVRVDTGVRTDDKVSVHFDPLLAKVITHAPTRAEATRLLADTLRRARVHGVTTNKDLLVGVLEHAEFGSGQIDTHFLDRHPAAELTAEQRDDGELAAAVAAAALASQAGNRDGAKVLRSMPSGWRNNSSQPQQRRYEHAGAALTVRYRSGRESAVEVDGKPLEVQVISARDSGVELLVGGVRRKYRVRSTPETVFVDSSRRSWALRRVPRFPEFGEDVATGSLLAPMPGTVSRVSVQAGDVVEAGAALVVLEAMKMEHRVKAPAGGAVTRVCVEVGSVVEAGEVLVVLDEGAS